MNLRNGLKKLLALGPTSYHYGWATKYPTVNQIAITNRPEKRQHAVCVQASQQLRTIAAAPTSELPAYMGLAEMQNWLNERGLAIVSEHPTHWWAQMVHSLNNGDVIKAHELCYIPDYMELTKP